MTEVDWPTVRRQASEQFGELPPHPEVEDEIVTVFEQYPAEVMRAITHLGERIRQGARIGSGWRVLRKECSEIASPRHRTVASVDDNRDAKIRAAEQWIRNAGVHFDLEREVEDELFGDLGILRDWAADQLLRDRLLRLWREQRPRGERCETEEAERAVRYREGRARVKAQLAGKRTEEEIPMGGAA